MKPRTGNATTFTAQKEYCFPFCHSFCAMYMKSFPADIVLDGPMHLRGYVDCEKCHKLMGVERALTHERYVWHKRRVVT